MSGWVLGCHRSGTSLLSGLLRSALPDQHQKILGSDIPESLANPYGHYESKEICDANEQILRWAGSQWDHPFLVKPNWSCKESIELLISLRKDLRSHCTENLWIDKDPRLCLTRDAWVHILLKDLPSIAIIRNPFAVTQSLFRRDGFSLAKSGLIWLLYNLHIFDSSSSPPVAVLLFDDLVTDEEARRGHAVEGILRFLSSAYAQSNTIPFNLDSSRIHNLIETHSNRALIRNEPHEESLLSPDLSRQLVRTWAQLKEAVQDRCDAQQIGCILRYAWADCSPWLIDLLREPLHSEPALNSREIQRHDLISRIARRFYT